MKLLRYLQMQCFGPEVCPTCGKEVDHSHPLGMCPDYEDIMFHRGHIQKNTMDVSQKDAGGNG